MLRSIFLFEVRYHLRQPLFYLVLSAFTVLGFLAISGDAVRLVGAIGNVHRNAPIVLLKLLGMLSVLGIFVNTAFVASSAQRDFETGIAELFFSKPVKKMDYLLGRFLGSLAVSLLVYIGPVLGILLGTSMPWIEAERLGPLALAPYVFALLVVVLPNLIFTGGVFFALAAWTRSLLYTYLGVVVFFGASEIAEAVMADAESLTLASLSDPFGLKAVEVTTRYWTVAEQNLSIPQLAGPLFWNRLVWMLVGCAIFALGCWRFSTEKSPGRRRWWQKEQKRATSAALRASFSPRRPSFGPATTWRQFLWATRLEVLLVFRSAPFLVMLAFGAFFVFGGASYSETVFGTTIHPVTHLMLTTIDKPFRMLLAILLTAYAGELVFRERGAKLAEVSDALPTPNGVFVASKLAALGILAATTLAVGALTTMAFQALAGFTHFQLGLYAQGLLILLYPYLLLACLAVFLQVAANHKFLGYLLMVGFLISRMAMRGFDFDHHLYRFAGTPPAPYSDMNGYGHFLEGVFAFDLYWTFAAILLVVLAILFWVRGRDTSWHFRRRLALARLRGGTRLTLVLAALGFVATGAFIFYNTNVLNQYVPGDAKRREQASYEKKYRQYLDQPQPRVVAAKVDVDIFPKERRMAARGTFTLQNKTQEPQSEIRFNLASKVHLLKLELPAHQVKVDDEELGFHILELTQPLGPGEKLDISFEVAAGQQGFVNGDSETRLVENGTFFNNGDFFPTFGYLSGAELVDANQRRKNGLGPKEHFPPASDLVARRRIYVTDDADWVDFETTVSTSEDQIAIAPGYLQKEWQEGGRRYFHYKMDAPILNFYSYLSARYAVKKDHWNDVAIDVYYDPQHPFNVDRMIDSVKKSLEYCSREFGPYQHRQLRILEFPRYAQFAQAFPNTVPFSESMGFIAKLDSEEAIDYVFYVTAHEVAHQWWAHQVIGGAVQGATLLSESFAQYSALMVVEKEYGKEKMRRFLKFELDTYLRGRGRDRIEEVPLAQVEDQNYIHYGKGAVILYALGDELGEETLNRALSRFRAAKAFQEPPYTTAEEFLDVLKEEAPAEKLAMIEDFFHRITLLENKVDTVTYAANSDGTYKVRIEADIKKYYASGQGEETEAPLDAWLDVGVFGEEAQDGKRQEKVLFLQKRQVHSGLNVFEVNVAEKPSRAGVDPYNKWIDRNSDDNILKAEEGTL